MSQLDPESEPWASLLSDGQTVWIHDHYHQMMAQGLFSRETLPIVDVDFEQVWIIDRKDIQFYADTCEEEWGPVCPTPVAMPLYSAALQWERSARCDAVVAVCQRVPECARVLILGYLWLTPRVRRRVRFKSPAVVLYVVPIRRQRSGFSG